MVRVRAVAGVVRVRAVAAVAAGVAAVAAEVVDEQGKRFVDPTRQELPMSNFTSVGETLARIPARAGALFVALCFATSAHAASDASAQRVFKSADEAAAALVKSLKSNDTAGAFAILGPGSDKWVRSGDAVAAKPTRENIKKQ